VTLLRVLPRTKAAIQKITINTSRTKQETPGKRLPVAVDTPSILPVVCSPKLIANINTIHVMIILVDYYWDRKVFLVLPVEYLPYLLLK